MKKIILCIILTTTLLHVSFAGNSATSVRTASGQLVSVGDSYGMMIDKFKQAFNQEL